MSDWLLDAADVNTHECPPEDLDEAATAAWRADRLREAREKCWRIAIEWLIGQVRPTSAEMLALEPASRTIWCSAALWLTAFSELEALDDIGVRRVRAVQRMAGPDVARDFAARLDILSREAREAHRGV